MDLAILPPPPVLRRQTHAFCESCGETRERYGIGYVCWNCGTTQTTHNMSFEQFARRVINGLTEGPFSTTIQQRLSEYVMNLDDLDDSDDSSDSDESDDDDLPKIRNQVGGSIELFTVLSLMTVHELMSLAKDIKVKGRSKMNKSGLISALLSLI